MSDRYLLPSNASAQEVALAGAIARISDVQNPVADLYTASLCPAAMLPWLSWAFSVDEWNPEWTESQKRQAIANSVFVHRHKGTVAALRKALDALGYDLTLTEWHQLEPKGDPYTFGLVLDVSETGMADTDEFDRIVDVTNGAKNARSHMNFFNLRGTVSGSLNFGGIAYAGETVDVAADETSIVMSDVWADGVANGFTSTQTAIDALKDCVNNQLTTW